MRYFFVAIALVALLFLHQNYAIWDRDDLVFGFLPFQLAYDGVLSLVTALGWIAVVTWAWPADADVEESRKRSEGGR